MSVEIVTAQEGNLPANDRYFASKQFRLLPLLYGERGKFAIDLYTYFRWVDDVIDESSTTKQEAFGFIDRQINLANRMQVENLNPIERLFQDGHWDRVPEKDVRLQSTILLNSLREDINQRGLVPWKPWELRHNNLRILFPCMEGLNLVINGKYLNAPKEFAEMLHHWNSLGNILDLEEDLQRGVCKVGFSLQEFSRVEKASQVSGRKAIIQEIYDPIRRKYVEDFHRSRLRELSSSFFRTLMPAWQRFICYAYLRI